MRQHCLPTLNSIFAQLSITVANLDKRCNKIIYGALGFVVENTKNTCLYLFQNVFPPISFRYNQIIELYETVCLTKRL